MLMREKGPRFKEVIVAESEMVYGWDGVELGYFMQYVVPKRDVFFRDLAKVRGWKVYDKEAGMYCYSELSERTKKTAHTAFHGL